VGTPSYFGLSGFSEMTMLISREVLDEVTRLHETRRSTGCDFLAGDDGSAAGSQQIGTMTSCDKDTLMDAATHPAIMEWLSCSLKDPSPHVETKIRLPAFILLSDIVFRPYLRSALWAIVISHHPFCTCHIGQPRALTAATKGLPEVVAAQLVADFEADV
jgi:hypothetical protein